MTVHATKPFRLHSGFLLRAVASAGPEADPHIVAMMTALGVTSVQWLRHQWPKKSHR